MFVELSATSNFTFLTGGSHPQDYIRRAGFMSMPALAVADENSVAGIVRAHSEAREIGRVVAERQALEAEQGLIGPPVPPGLPPTPSLDIATVPRLIPAARLVTEEGVDLNRNFVDFAQPLPENPYARTTTPRFSTKDCASTTRRRQP